MAWKRRSAKEACERKLHYSIPQGILSVFLAVFCFFQLPVHAYTSPGKPVGFINDFAGVLSQETRSSLESDLRGFANGENPEISVAIIKTLGTSAIEEYANRLFREWGVGLKTKNNGLLFLIAVDDRKMRIEVGYGLEGVLTDIETKYIQERVVRPAFQAGKFDEGVRRGISEIQKALQEELVEQAVQQRSRSKLTPELFELLFFFIVFGFSWLGSIFGRSKSWWAGGVIGGIVGGMVGFFTGWFFWILIAAFVGLVFDYVVSKNYQAHRGHPAWWAGGGWGGWDRFGGGGFGGFGGGSSGGGGSSSSW